VDLVTVETTEELRNAVLSAAKGQTRSSWRRLRPTSAPRTWQTKRSRNATTDGAHDRADRQPGHRRRGGPGEESGQVLVAFAAETQNAIDNAAQKLTRKRADLIVVNDVGTGRVFGSDGNEAVILDASGGHTALPRMSKDAVAYEVWDRVVKLLSNVQEAY
jgi:phosphopantothenoylcysteine decarboxylase/phosphopantothenate--cysteine ligase